MSLFGAITSVIIDIVKLPVELPLAIAKDTIETLASCELSTEKTREVIEEIKEDANK